MTVGMRDFVTELGREPLLFRETFRSRAAVERNGATLVGTGTTFGGDGVTFDGNGNLSYAVSGAGIFRSTLTFVIEFTFGFALDEGVLRILFDGGPAAGVARCVVSRGLANTLDMSINGSNVLSVAYAVWSPWAVAGRNQLVISTTSGASAAWLNGTVIGTSVTAWPAGNISAITTVAIGARYTNVSRWIGIISRFEIYGSTCTSVDEPYLRRGNLIESIDFSKSLAYLPGVTSYQRTSDSLFVTEVGGKGTVREALMGSDGSTTAQFPSIITPRGFSFDGGDQINLGDSDQFSFTTGSADKPFSLSCLARQTANATALLMGKATASNNGEYILALFLVGSDIRVYFIQVDETAVAWIGRYGVVGPNAFLRYRALVATSDGTGIGGMKILLDGVRIDTTNTTSSSYSRMRNTSKALLVGGGNAGYTALNGNVILPAVWDFEIPPLGGKALSARMLRLARAA